MLIFINAVKKQDIFTLYFQNQKSCAICTALFLCLYPWSQEIQKILNALLYLFQCIDLGQLLCYLLGGVFYYDLFLSRLQSYLLFLFIYFCNVLFSFDLIAEFFQSWHTGKSVIIPFGFNIKIRKKKSPMCSQ